MIEKEFRFKSDKGEIYIKSWSEANYHKKAPVVLLHDSLGSVKLWKDFPSKLASVLEREIIAYDRLGFGQSEKVTEKLPLDFIRNEAMKVFPEIKKFLAINKYILAGHSVGGAMAVEISARDKDCLALITESAQAFIEEKTLNGIRDAKLLFSNYNQKSRLKKWHGDKTEWVLNSWIETWLSDDFANWSLEGSIQKVQCPVLAIHGENDEYGSIAFPEFICGKSDSQSEIFIIKDCGHVPHREKEALVISKINEFLLKYQI